MPKVMKPIILYTKVIALHSKVKWLIIHYTKVIWLIIPYTKVKFILREPIAGTSGSVDTRGDEPPRGVLKYFFHAASAPQFYLST